MGAVLEGWPIPTPLDRDILSLGGGLHGRSELMVERPIPAHRTADHRGEIDGMAGEMPRVHGLSGALVVKLLLPRGRAQPFQHREVERRHRRRLLHDANEVRVDPFQPHQRPLAEDDAHLTPSNASKMPISSRMMVLAILIPRFSNLLRRAQILS